MENKNVKKAKKLLLNGKKDEEIISLGISEKEVSKAREQILQDNLHARRDAEYSVKRLKRGCLTVGEIEFKTSKI